MDSLTGLEQDGSERTLAEGSAWELSAEVLTERLRSDLARGLTNREARRRLDQFGPNALTQSVERSSLAIFMDQFRSLIVALLVAAALIAIVLGDYAEALAILVVILLNAAIGFLTEWKAAQALSALQKQSVRVADVIRENVEQEIPASELVPGDLVVLAAGARVPADGRIVECVRLQIEEAALTGESFAASKSAEILADPGLTLGDRRNMAFLGTTITNGRGRMLVTATGALSEVGKVGMLIDEAITRATPLERKLAKLGQTLIVIVLGLCGVIVIAGWLRGTADLWHMLEIGLSLAIAAVPEGLPAVTTMTLALGMQRMARLGTLVRRLPAVETLGSVTVICTDKTGTLTKNEMTVSVYALADRRIVVTGTGYELGGSFHEGSHPLDPLQDAHLTLALRIGALCNDAKVERTNDQAHVLGDPTEAALIVAAEKARLSPTALATDFPRLSEVPFDSASKRMITMHRTPRGQVLAYYKGSPGALLTASQTQFGASGVTPLVDEDRRQWEATNALLAGDAFRVLGLAYREVPDGDLGADLAECVEGLTFVGLVGMTDPLRDEAKRAISRCHDAGIRTIMITGDQQPTAAEIAAKLGINRDPEGRPLQTVHGRELTELDRDGWRRITAETAVFARVSPEHKLQIVGALQQQGHVVAMTGDGVNDAPALKKADIGIAMGIKGTEVAKENADMIITDDNFASIVEAVEQGRIIYGNIIKFLHYLLSCNLSEILTIFVSLMVGWPLPLGALQILWLNLVTDIFPAFALALEPSSPEAMLRPPRDQKSPLLTPRFVMLISWQGMMLTAVTLVAFEVGMRWHGDVGAGLRRATTMAFMTLALSQVFHVFNARSLSRSLFTRRLFSNQWLWGAVLTCIGLQLAAVYMPLLQSLLRTAPPSGADWSVIATCSLAPVVLVELTKLMHRTLVRFGPRTPSPR